MTRLVSARAAIHFIEASIITALLVLVTYRGMVGVSGAIVTVMHTLALLSAYLIVHGLLSMVHPIAASLFFSVCVITLILEAIIQQFTGLHLNWFVLSLLLESESSQNIGISVVSWIIALLAISIVTFLASRKLPSRYVASLPYWRICLLFISTITIGQLTYSIAFYEGRSEIMQVKRNLPFFVAPHPYHVRQAISLIAGPAETNPFSDVQIDRTTNPSMITEPNIISAQKTPNILFVITDSLRASELEEYPALAPTLMSYKDNAWLSLNHYSVSNCTHFSLYTMFTGRIATSFGQARQSGTATGLINDMVSAGYEASTSESISLDWYDIEKILLPPAVNRWLPPTTLSDQSERDLAVKKNTIEQLSSWKAGNTPRVHITYFNGSHYPYGASIANSGNSALERYHATIEAFDTHLAQILSALEDNGQLDNTIVIVTSDHGEELLADGRIGHASALSELQTHVPILVIGGNQTTQNIKSHADIRSFILNQLSPEEYPFNESEALYLAGCDYDHPRDFRVITDDGAFAFDYNDGYLAALDKTAPQSFKAAKLLLKTIQNDGLPAQE